MLALAKAVSTRLWCSSTTMTCLRITLAILLEPVLHVGREVALRAMAFDPMSQPAVRPLRGSMHATHR